MAFCGVTFTEEKRGFEIFPTVSAARDFDAEEDAKVFEKAMKGMGTDERKIISIVANRSTEQLKEVETKFKTLFGEDLRKMLEGELKGNFEKVVIGRFHGKIEYQAYILRKAMKGAGTDEETLIDVICSKNAHEMGKIKDDYKDMYERDLVKDLESETSGDVGRILVSLATANRETKEPDHKLAKEEAQMLFDAGEDAWGTDEKVFNQIFATRSFGQLKLTFLLYRSIASKLIFESIEKEMSGKLKLAFLTIAQYISDPITYYSEVIYTSMDGMGTNDDRLIRAIVSRCEIDLKTVEGRYNKLHDTKLVKRIQKETSGDYEKILVALVSC